MTVAVTSFRSGEVAAMIDTFRGWKYVKRTMNQGIVSISQITLEKLQLLVLVTRAG